jgi:hypothetical protein
MIERGHVLLLDHRDGLNRRFLVFADHPEGPGYVADVKSWAVERRQMRR